MKLIYFTLAILLLRTGSIAQKLDHISYGKYHIGFLSQYIIDYSRPSLEAQRLGRKITVNVWYPTPVNSKNKMSFFDYTVRENVVAFKTELSKGADTTGLNAFLKTKTHSQLNAILAEGKWPVVVLLHGSAFQYMLLGQYLASHGMIAIGLPYQGFLQKDIDVNVIGMETQIRDAEFAVGEIQKKYKLDIKNIGVLGYSFGGQSAVGYAVRNPLTKAMVSLDGGIGSDFGPYLLNNFPFFKIDQFQTPLLHLYNPHDIHGNIKWFEQTHFNDNYLIALENMDHGYFGTHGWLDKLFPNKTKLKIGNNPEIILWATLHFFQNAFQGKEITSLELKKNYTWTNENIVIEELKKKIK